MHNIPNCVQDLKKHVTIKSKGLKKMDCIFCKIIENQIESKKLYEDDLVLVFLDIDETTPGHTLIIPKKHIEDYTKLDQETLCHMFKIANKISKILMEKLNKKGISLLFNYGESQIIKHTHLHLLPDFEKNNEPQPVEKIYSLLKDAF